MHCLNMLCLSSFVQTDSGLLIFWLTGNRKQTKRTLWSFSFCPFSVLYGYVVCIKIEKCLTWVSMKCEEKNFKENVYACETEYKKVTKLNFSIWMSYFLQSGDKIEFFYVNDWFSSKYGHVVRCGYLLVCSEFSAYDKLSICGILYT